MKRSIITFLTLGVIASLCSCNRSAETPETRAQRANGERLARIAKASGGDWDTLSEDDRQFLVNDIAHGSEQTARMLILPPGSLNRRLPGASR